jgi:excisionase family DNA binding protein
MATADSNKSDMDIGISEKDQKEIQELYLKLKEAEAKLVSPDGKVEVLPPNINSFLFRVLSDLRAGCSITILQGKAQLTTVEASKLLGVSRQFLIGMLDRGEIQFHMVGTHRRIYAKDILHYKSKRDAKRTKLLDDLTEAEERDGLYDKRP